VALSRFDTNVLVMLYSYPKMEERRKIVMSHFTQAEIEYFASQRLGRLATVGSSGEPHVVPVSFRYNAELDSIDIGGHGIAKSKKFRDVARSGRAAFVVDDVLPPWRPRGIEVRGVAETHDTGGKEVMADFDPELIRIYPTRIVGWGLDSDAFHSNSRTIKR
jgi:pyridoxamine 5'-phosphate oxidase family protein